VKEILFIATLAIISGAPAYAAEGGHDAGGQYTEKPKGTVAIPSGVIHNDAATRQHRTMAQERSPAVQVQSQSTRQHRTVAQEHSPEAQKHGPAVQDHPQVVKRNHRTRAQERGPAAQKHNQAVQDHPLVVQEHRQVVRQHYEFHGHDVHRFSRKQLARWRGGRWNNTCYGGRCGWWWFAGGQWYFYDSPIYPYPLEVSAITYLESEGAAAAVAEPTMPVVQPAPAPAFSAQSLPQVWYFCAAANAYYPYVSSCPSGWQIVPAAPQPNIPSIQSAVPRQ
jgi:hypothetical protein